jgi:hypothetical protein
LIGFAEEQIASHILELCFGNIEKIWRDFEVNLFPYSKSVKAIVIIEDVIKKTHKNNLDNVFHVLGAFFNGRPVFPDQ